MIKLYGYWRSTAAYRVRIALALKGIEYQSISIHLVNNGGEQHQAEYERINPSHLVPTLVDGDFVLNQSLAIIDYLDEINTNVALYPIDLKIKAKARALALDISCEVHPLNNLRVQQYLTKELFLNNEAKSKWIEHWMFTGFSAVESQLLKNSGRYCFGDNVTVADICLVAQVYNANRFNVSMDQYPTIMKVVNNCNQLDAFIQALPENQKDAQL